MAIFENMAKGNLNKVIAILASTAWISISEFVRNQFLLESSWVAQYNDLGLEFPAKPINGAVWGIWSLCFAICIFFLYQKMSFKEAFWLSWIFGFVMMWLVIGNLNVLPFGILPMAIPLSMLEVYIALFICKKLTPNKI